MKVSCPKCEKNMQVEINKSFENFLVGQVDCVKWNYTFKRYISEADLEIYLAITETFYLLLSIIFKHLLDNFGFNILIILLIVVIVVLTMFMFKQVGNYIFINGLLKKEWVNLRFNEDIKKVRRAMTFQQILFIALVLMYFMGQAPTTMFLIAAALANIVSYLRYVQIINRERSE